MRMRAILASGLLLLVAGHHAAAAQAPASALGYSRNTEILPRADGSQDPCPGTEILQQDDGNLENAYAWEGAGVQAPEYGAWAECFTADYVCAVELLLTQTGGYQGQTLDLYLWEKVAPGKTIPGPQPGNVICFIPDVHPGAVAMWPQISSVVVRVCCPTGGEHFAGFWPQWPGESAGFYLAADETPPGHGCPRTKIAPGLGYPSGWNHPTAVPVFSACTDVGIREWAGPGDCAPTPVHETTWGRIKSLY
jgi:hypothetical protein